MTSNKTKKVNYCIIIFTFILFSIFSTVLFLHMGKLYGASDMHFHMNRMMEIRDSIISGHMFSNYALNYFHGSAILGMYPYISIIPFALLTIIVHSIIYGYYIFSDFILFVAFTIAFFSCLNISKSVKLSYIFSILYGSSSTFIFEMFTNGDIGVATSIAILPLVIFGFLNIMRDPYNNKEFICGCALMFYCQLPAAIITILFIIIWLLVNVSNITILIIKSFFKSFITILLLISFEIISIFRIITTNSIHTVVRVILSGATPKLLIENLSFVAMLSVVISLFYFNKFNKIHKQMFLLSILIIFISSKLMPWGVITDISIFRIFNSFQFAFRFLIIPQMLLTYLLSIIIIKFLKRSYKLKLFISILFVIILQLSIQGFILHKKVNTPNISINSIHSVKLYEEKKHKNIGCVFDNNKSIKYFVNGYFDNSDYYPKATLSKRYYIHNNLGLINNRKLFKLHHIGYNKFCFNIKKSDSKVTLPLIKYNNESLRIYLNKRLVNSYRNKNKLITINHVKKGINVLYIKNNFNESIILIEIIFIILGILSLTCNL